MSVEQVQWRPSVSSLGSPCSENHSSVVLDLASMADVELQWDHYWPIVWCQIPLWPAGVSFCQWGIWLPLENGSSGGNCLHKSNVEWIEEPPHCPLSDFFYVCLNSIGGTAWTACCSKWQDFLIINTGLLVWPHLSPYKTQQGFIFQ